MAGRQDPGRHGLAAALTGDADLRVWSVIITIFGDAVAPRGGVVAVSVLAALTAPLGIGAGALRVALHRLVRDGWLIRERRGRASFYALSPRGVAEFAPASRRIYAAAPAAGAPLALGLADPGLDAGARAGLEARMSGAGWQPVGAGVWLGPAAAVPAPGVFTLAGTGGEVPGWLRARLGPPELSAAYAALVAELRQLAAALDGDGGGPGRSDGATAAALRVLVVHRWRRLVLRHADLPAAYLPGDWPGETCRDLVLALHRRLSAAADPWLDAEIAPRRQPLAK